MKNLSIKNPQLYLIFISFLMPALFTSCNTETILSTSPQLSSLNEKTDKYLRKNTAQEEKDSTKRTISSIVGPMALSCDTKFVEYWAFHHYESVPGKVVGIWPHGSRFSGGKLGALHRKWGFNYICMSEIWGQDKYLWADTAGFPLSNTMIQVSTNTYQALINNYANRAWAFYCDEPTEKGYPLNSIINYRNSYSPLTPFIISGYKRNMDFSVAVHYSDVAMYSAYIEWRNYLGTWVSWPVEPDQRDSWTGMREDYGSKFSHTWIGAHRDLSEYSDLLGHAMNLGLNGIWLYQLEETEPYSDANLSAFCEAAWVRGWLLRVEEQHVVTYRCTLPNPCLNCDREDEYSWEFVQDIPQKIFRRY